MSVGVGPGQRRGHGRAGGPTPNGGRGHGHRRAQKVQNRFVFLDVFRGIAPVLVVYSHVVALYFDPHDLQSPVVNLLSEQARDPLRLEQHMGHLAVVMFFLVSGFIVTHVGVQESHREFAAKRFFRIFPLLWFAVLFSAVMGLLGMEVLRTGQHFEVTVKSVLSNMVLVNYVMVPQVILLGVAWTLIIELIFYSTILLLLPVLRRWAWAAIMIELAGVFLVVLFARDLGNSFFLFAVSVSYLPVVLLGQVTWAVWSKRIPLWAGLLFGAACWTLYVWADNQGMGRLDEAYNSTFAIGFVLFIALLLAEEKLRPTRPISFFADRSYSMYLLHGPIAFPIFEALHGKLPLPLIVLAGLSVTVGAAELTYRFIEVPGQRIARKVTKRWRLPPPPRAQDQDRADQPRRPQRRGRPERPAPPGQPELPGQPERPARPGQPERWGQPDPLDRTQLQDRPPRRGPDERRDGYPLPDRRQPQRPAQRAPQQLPRRPPPGGVRPAPQEPRQTRAPQPAPQRVPRPQPPDARPRPQRQPPQHQPPQRQPPPDRLPPDQPPRQPPASPRRPRLSSQPPPPQGAPNRRQPSPPNGQPNGRAGGWFDGQPSGPLNGHLDDSNPANRNPNGQRGGRPQPNRLPPSGTSNRQPRHRQP